MSNFMSKSLIVSLAGILLPLSVAGGTLTGVNQFYTADDGVKYEILDFDAHTLGVAGLSEDAQDFALHFAQKHYGRSEPFGLCSGGVLIVPVVPEDDYQDIVEQEKLLLEQEENAEIAGKSAPARKARRESDALASGKQFARVFNGASIRSTGGQNSKGNRYFISGEPGVDYEGVYLNEVNITDQVVDGMLLLPADADGSLRIVGYGSGVSTPAVDGSLSSADMCEAYDLSGVKVYTGIYGDLSGHVAPGIYVVRTVSGNVVKISVK